jgi:hypothetical protein
MKRLAGLILASAMFGAGPAAADTVTGTWKTVDEKSGRAASSSARSRG